jgi:glycosyltransferase involved in cell wall biosynthesis
MRILVLGNCQGSGGGPTHFRLLMEFLLSQGHHVFGVGVGDKNLCQIRIEGLENFVRLDQTTAGLGAKVRKLIALNRAIKQADRFHPDLFIAIGYGNAYSYLAKRLPPDVFKFYQELITNPPSGDPMRSSLVHAFDAVAVQSPAMRAPFLRNIPTAKPVISLPCFSDAPAVGQIAVLPKLGEKLRLVYCGRLAANKGIPQFIEAFAQVHEHIEATFDIYGGGSEHDKIAERIQQLGLSEVVQLKGRYPGVCQFTGFLPRSRPAQH